MIDKTLLRNEQEYETFVDKLRKPNYDNFHGWDVSDVSPPTQYPCVAYGAECNDDAGGSVWVEYVYLEDFESGE